ncbi:hypothetical protein BDP27DRAFT_1378792 [Rhodocollybia butyracea]|uniref:DM2 domain-containing protein n=1 Tax=Rhodocollybia butyracea TaxID=206335 RepID=A0A9P5QAV2_9AGAR|nr:hypothetical protein BDP27DRAFT_1378792 [Rhodocollybia butyracea]
MDGKANKRRKLTDKSLTNVILQNPDFAEDSQIEKLDWTITRKRMEIQDTLSRNPTTTRTLRLFVKGENMAHPETGESIPAWQLKIEGRLLEVPSQRGKDKAPTQVSTFIKRMMVEFDRDTNVYPENNIVEWPRATGNQNPSLDGPELSNILGIKEESRLGVASDKGDRRHIHTDDKLRAIFGVDSISFPKLPEYVNRHLAPPEPIVLRYSFDPSVSPQKIKMEDAALKSRMGVMLHMNKDSTVALGKMDDEIALLAQSLHNSHLKRTFLQSFANDPAKFIQTWLESQSRDLESILGAGASEGLTLRQEELRRSEFFRLPWVEEAVSVQEGIRLSSKIQ